MKRIIPLSELVRSDVRISGEKAVSLGELIRSGVAVPNGFVITAEALKGHLPVEEVLDAFDRLGAEFVAVRPSVVSEGMMHSWAGQLEAFLGVKRDSLIDRIRESWSSMKSSKATAYMEKKGIRKGGVSVAVIVQRLIDADVSGICFTSDPGDKTRMVVKAGLGLGNTIVGGLIEPDLYIIDKGRMKITEDKVNTQRAIGRLGRDELEVRDLDEVEGGDRKLKKDACIRLAEVCQQIEDYFAKPQVVEWCIEGDRLFIVQSGPASEPII